MPNLKRNTAIAAQTDSTIASIPAEIFGVVTRWLEENGTGAPEDLRVAVEEGLELDGWILAAVGLTTAVCVALTGYRTVPART